MTNRTFLITSSLFSLCLSASLFAADGSPVVSGFPEKVTLQYLAPAGEVRQGEVVAVLDCTPLTATLKSLSADIETLEAALKEATERLEITVAINQEKLDNAREAVEVAERALTRYRENDAPGAEVTLKLTLHDAETEFKKQTERYATRDRLLQEGFIHKVEYDNEETRLKRTELALEAARLKMDAFVKYEKSEREAGFKRDIRKAKDDLAELEREIEAGMVSVKAAVEENQAQLEVAVVERDRFSRQLDKTIVRADKAGQFTPVENRKADASLDRGMMVANGQVLGHIRD